MASFDYEQDFNALNTADLNGQDSWANQADAIVNVQEAVVYEGAKATIYNDNTNNLYYLRTITTCSDGDFYWAMRKSLTNQAFSGLTFRQSNSNGRMWIFMQNDGYFYLNDTKTDYAYSADTWYIINLQFDTDDDEYRIRVKTSGGTWGSWSSYKAMGGTSGQAITKIGFTGDHSTAATYWDDITLTNPEPDTELKSVNGILAASVKSINGVAIADVKSVNGIT